MLNRIFRLWPMAGLCLLASSCVPPELDFSPDIIEPPAKLQETIAIGSTLSATPDYVFYSDRAGDLYYQGDCSSTTSKAVVGFNTITFSALADGLHTNCKLIVRNADGAYSDPLAVSAFTVVLQAMVGSIRPVMLVPGFETRISGHNLSTASLLVNGSAVTPTLQNEHEIRFIAPSLAAGTYTLALNKSLSAANYSTSVTVKASLLPEGEVVVGGSFACARKSTGAGNGTVWCWGLNSSGQLGNASTVASETPVQVSGITTAESITAGDAHACARLADGTAKCWGSNAAGQLGDNTTANKTSPVAVKDIAGTGTLANVTAISAGESHTCAIISGGTVNCWGLNSSGQLGDNTTVQKLIPVVVKDIAGTGTLGTASAVTAISAGANHNCAVLASTGVNCWGYNRYGGLGNNTTTASPYAVPLPVAVKGIGGTGTLTGVSSVSAGSYQTCAVLSSGGVNCWGYNLTGALGDNSLTQRNAPVAVKGVGGTGTLTSVAAVSTAQYHTCARLSDGSARCWGRNFAGQLGNNTTSEYSLTPVAVSGVNGSGSLSNVSAIATNSVSTCAKLSDSSIKCWGDVLQFSQGQYVVPALSNNIKSISLGGSHGCALLNDKTVKCWGLNSSGQLGDNSKNDSPSPVVVRDTTGAVGTTLSNVKAITVGASHNCALLDTTGNNVVCWGLNGNGQLGDTTSTSRTIPVVLTNITNATSVAAADTHTCASLSDGTAKCWGNNNVTYGKLGDGSGIADNSTPVYVKEVGGVGNLANVVSVSVGTSHACAILNTATNNLRCWGRNELGQLGDNTTVHRTTPVAVVGVGATGTLDNVAAVRLGGNHTCALLTDNSLKCWGYNTNGQVGDGTTVQKTSPVAILSNVTSVGADGIQTCATLTDKTAKCWGYNYYGQLGDNSMTQRTSPVAVANSKIVSTIEPGTSRTCAVMTDGAVMCAGIVIDRVRLTPQFSVWGP